MDIKKSGIREQNYIEKKSIWNDRESDRKEERRRKKKVLKEKNIRKKWKISKDWKRGYIYKKKS
jgi:hypothetical protein